jgi:hypothetical protein
MRIQSGKLCGISRITASRKGFKNGIWTIFTMGLYNPGIITDKKTFLTILFVYKN